MSFPLGLTIQLPVHLLFQLPFNSLCLYQVCKFSGETVVQQQVMIKRDGFRNEELVNILNIKHLGNLEVA